MAVRYWCCYVFQILLKRSKLHISGRAFLLLPENTSMNTMNTIKGGAKARTKSVIAESMTTGYMPVALRLGVRGLKITLLRQSIGFSGLGVEGLARLG